MMKGEGIGDAKSKVIILLGAVVTIVLIVCFSRTIRGPKVVIPRSMVVLFIQPGAGRELLAADLDSKQVFQVGTSSRSGERTACEWFTVASDEVIVACMDTQLVQYSLTANAQRVLGSFGEGALTDAYWAFPLKDGMVVFYPNSSELWLTGGHQPARKISSSVELADCWSSRYISILHHDGRLELMDLVSKRSHPVFRFGAGHNWYRFSVSPLGMVAVLDQNAMKIIDLHSHGIARYALERGWHTGVCWLGPHTIAYSNCTSNTEVYALDLVSGHSDRLFTFAGAFGGIKSMLTSQKPPNLFHHIIPDYIRWP